jgi:pimeloyl-ACP methyl ester carboxylesterase
VNSTETASNTTALTRYVTAGDNTYAYRRFGSGPGTPLLFLQHFTGTLDNWDPAVTCASVKYRKNKCLFYRQEKYCWASELSSTRSSS